MRGGSFGLVAEYVGVGVEGEESEGMGEVMEGEIIEGGVREGEDIGDENSDIVEDDKKKGCRSIKEKREQALSFRLQMIT